ncbi:MAG TPA: flagellar hook-length control protein FliK [Burkholderiaceae bacterium]|nr:flagellar hook-length control protein FliK [Burkholderiaceae bacterium]
MTDMRLAGLGPVNNDVSPKPGSTDSGSDPAQAFDAVMSRFSSQGAPARPSGGQDAPANTGNDTARTRAKVPATDKGQDTRPGGRPAARTKGLDDGSVREDPAATVAAADPAAMVAAVTGSAQLTAQDPALAATLDGVAAKTDKDKDANGGTASVVGAAGAVGTLDVLAVPGNALAAHAGERLAADARSPVASEDEVKAGTVVGTAARRAAVAGRDSPRIEAQQGDLAAASAKGEVLQRPATAASAEIAAAAQDAAPASTTAPTQIAAAAVAAAGNGAGTYSMAHAAVAAPVGSPSFSNELSQRVVVFAGQKVQRAEIALTPPELGPIAVSIEVRGQEATLAFAASNHVTRAAIENALPQLREMFSAQGLQLAGTHVGSEPRRDPYQPTPNGGNGNAAGSRGEREDVAAVSSQSGNTVRVRTNLIDIEV